MAMTGRNPMHRAFATGGSWLRLASLAGVLALAACNTSETSSSDFVDSIEPPDRLYNQALVDIDDGDLKNASKTLKKIDQQHPYSEYSRRAMVLQTFIHYRRKEFDDAIITGKRYVALYPGDKDAAYAQYLVGMSYFRQIPDVGRDQMITGRAYNSMNELVQRYPESEYVEDAKAKMRVALDQLAGKEMLTGRYYLERREYLAAINRFRRVVERFQKTRHVEEALARLTEAYLAMGIVNEAQTAAAVLGHNFPESQWYKDALALLEEQGATPQKNDRSWISQSFSTAPAESG
ncbi:MAG: outer membrane protein assembly factor BamD [Pseudomonadota bacterium]|nr:outer membrane protein assembly factor BamD [Pseudomonadota bacterium]